MKRVINQSLVYLLAAAVVLGDQYSKHIVRTSLPLNSGWNPLPWLSPYARILYIQNTGAAFGLFKEANLFFTVVAIIVSAVIIVYNQRLPTGHWGMRLALGLQLGGALGNLVDRLVFHTVTDFISIGNFAIFNVADASISTGVALLALIMWLEARNDRGRAPGSATLPPVDARETLRNLAEQIRTLAAPGGGERLDKSIAAALADLSRTQIQRLIEDGFVQVDGRVVVKPAFRLEAPASLQVRVPPPAPSSHRPEAIPLDIIFENDDLLVVNKPAGLVVHPAAGHFDGTLVNAVLAHAPDLEGVGDEQRPGIVHRLDKDTSGLIVIAKNDLAHRDLQRQFKDRSVEKLYLALLDGQPPTPTGRIEAAIGRDPRNRKRMAVVGGSQGRAAVTEYRVLVEYAAHSLVEARLLTGRTHQLRLHFAYLRCPITGDTVYGRHTPTLPLGRQFLHAASLSFDLPRGGQRVTFSAPLPPDLVQALPPTPVRVLAPTPYSAPPYTAAAPPMIK